MQVAPPEIRLLGLPEVQRDGGTHAVPVIDKPWGLLFFLAVERELHDREALAAFFWPDKSPRAGRANLSATLYTLGRWFGPHLPLEKNARSVRWGRWGVAPKDKGVSGHGDPVDLARFFSDDPQVPCDRLHSCLLCPDCRVATASRLALCRGDFLEGALLKVHEPFLRWVDRIRERVAIRKGELLRRLGPAGVPEKAASHAFVSVSGPLWERRQITFLGVLVSAPSGMEAEERLDGEQAWRTAAESLLRAGRGWLLPSVEISLLAAFGYPLPREDAASGALTTARAVVRAFRDLAPPGFEIRTVLHTGEGTIDRFRNFPDATGDRSLETARLVREAPCGEIAVSDPTARLLSRTVRSVPLGKSVPDRDGGRIGLVLLTGEEPPEAGSDRSLFGREEELSRLRGLWKEVAGGGSRTVWLTGEAGIGKSALVRALARLVASGAELPPGAFREYRCHPDSGEIPWDPVVRVLRRFLGPEGERLPPVERRYRAERLLLEASLPVSENLPALLHLVEGPGPWSGELLHHAPEGLRPRIEQLLLRLFSGPEEIPLLLVVEDLHWADHATADLLRGWGARRDRRPTLLLLTARDEAAMATRGLPLPDLAIPVRRLDRGAARLVVESAAEGPLPPERLRELLDRGEGVPLFLRELTRSGATPAPSEALPATLRDLLAARLGDPGEERGALETAACLGSSFSLSLLAEVESERTGGPVSPERLCSSLRVLSARGLLEEDRPGEDPVWDFTHVLLREAVLAALPSRLRRSLHRAIVQTLRSRFPERVEREPEILAEHLALAGDASGAVAEWIRAAALSASLGASRDALAALGKALSLVREDRDIPEAELRELEILLVMGPLALAVHGYGSRTVEEVYERASALCREEEGRDCPFPVLLGLASSAFIRNGPAGARTYLGRLERRAREAKGTEALRARVRIGAARFWEGRLSEAQRILSEVSAHSGSSRETGWGKGSFAPYAEDPGAGACGYLSFVSQIAGRTDEALRFSLAAGARTRRIGDSGSAYSAGFAATFAAYLHFLRRDRGRASERAAATVALSKKYGYLQWETMGRLLQSWCRADGASVPEAREAVERLREMVPGILPLFLLVQAETALEAGFPEEALEAARRGREAALRTGAVLFDPEFDRVVGEAFAGLDPVGFREETERLFLKAREEARKSGRHWFAFRAALALSRLASSASPEAAELPECLSRLSGGESLPEVREARTRISRSRPG